MRERSQASIHFSLLNLFKFVLSMLAGEEGLQAEDACHFWNPHINKRLKIKDQQQRYNGVAMYSSSSQLPMHHSVSDGSGLIYGEGHAKLEIWIGYCVGSHELGKRKLHSLWPSATRDQFLLCALQFDAQIKHNNFEH